MQNNKHTFIIGPYSDRFLDEIRKFKFLSFLPDNKYEEFNKRHQTNSKMGVMTDLTNWLDYNNNLHIISHDIFVRKFISITSLDIEENSPRINFDMNIAKQLYNSIFCVDECQNLYNQRDYNKYGFIVCFINKLYGNNIKILLASATPIFYESSVSKFLHLIHFLDNKNHRVEEILDVLTEINNMRSLE